MLANNPDDLKSIDIALGRHAVALAKREWGNEALEPHLRSLVSEPDNVCRVDGQWYVVSLEMHQEKLARAEVAGRGLVPYLPMTPSRERHGRGGERTVMRPMLGPYMFVKCSLTDDSWNKITTARGVRRFLGIGGRPCAIDDQRIEVIRLFEAEESEQEQYRLIREEASKIAKAGGKSGIIWHFSPGDVIRIKNGPFAGFYAELESAVDSHDRIKAVLNFLGCSTPTELSAFDIEAL